MLQRQTNRTAAPPRPLLQRFRAAFAAAASPKRQQNPSAPDATTPAPLDVERARLRADGYNEQEASDILVAAWITFDAQQRSRAPWMDFSSPAPASLASLFEPLPRRVPAHLPENLPTPNSTCSSCVLAGSTRIYARKRTAPRSPRRLPSALRHLSRNFAAPRATTRRRSARPTCRRRRSKAFRFWACHRARARCQALCASARSREASPPQG